MPTSPWRIAPLSYFCSRFYERFIKMQTGQTFVVDAQAVEDTAKFYKKTLAQYQALGLVGRTFSIAKSRPGHEPVSALEVRASAWEDGKPRIGRPRRFPRCVVARLLGELNDASLTNPVGIVTAPAAAPATEADAETALNAAETPEVGEPAVAVASSASASSW